MIGDRIKELRKVKSLSQQALAILLSTASGYISEIEQGKTQPGSKFLCSLKREFPEIDLNWLLTGECSIRVAQPLIMAEPSALYLAEITPEQKKKLKLRNMLSRILDEGDQKKIKAVEAQLDILDPGEKKPRGSHENDGSGGDMGGLVA